MIRLLIVADIRLYREGLMQVLASQPRLAVVGSAADLPEALRPATEREFDVALIDMAMPCGLQAIRALTAGTPPVKVVALGIPEIERDLIACAEAGIAGYLPRGASVTDLVAVLEGVARGELLCSPRAAATLLRRVTVLAAGNPVAVEQAPGVLTPREREIAAFLEAGLSNKDIAVRLGIEIPTVKNHVHNVLEKLRVHRRGEAAARLRDSRSLPGARRVTPTAGTLI